MIFNIKYLQKLNKKYIPILTKLNNFDSDIDKYQNNIYDIYNSHFNKITNTSNNLNIIRSKLLEDIQEIKNYKTILRNKLKKYFHKISVQKLP